MSQNIRNTIWSVAQEWTDEKLFRADFTELPDSYRSQHEGRPGMFKRVLLVAGAEPDTNTLQQQWEPVVIADLTDVARRIPGRTPRLDADLGEYICKLHNDELARKQV